MLAHTLGKSVQSRRCHRDRETAQALRDRGLLRRLGRDLRREARRHVRRSCDHQLLSRAPHHDRRRRCGARRTGSHSPRSSNPTATGAATAGARRPKQTPAASDSNGAGRTAGGYDHKYTYSHIGYNLKATDMQAAVGLGQLQKARRLHRGPARRISRSCRRRSCAGLDEHFVLPQATPGIGPELVRLPADHSRRRPFKRRDVVTYLENNKVARGCCSEET